MFAGAFDIRAKNDVFSGIPADPGQGISLPGPALQSSINRTATGAAGRTTPRSGPAITCPIRRVDDLSVPGHLVGPVTGRLTVSVAFLSDRPCLLMSKPLV